MRKLKNDIYLDNPLIKKSKGKKYVLAIKPIYHSEMFPDSILRTENKGIIKDVSYVKSINKIYVCSMYIAKRFRKGDILLLYRSSEEGKMRSIVQ